MGTNHLCLVYVTVSSIEEGKTISNALLDKHLIACANLLPKMTSMYRWQGKLETAEEVVLILKTTRNHFSEIEKIVKALHSYEVPCLLQLNVEQVAESYGKWLLGEIKS